MSLIQKKIDGKERSQEEAWEELLYNYNYMCSDAYNTFTDNKNIFDSMVKVFNRSIGVELATHKETV